MSITFPTRPWIICPGMPSGLVRVNLRYEPNVDPYAVALIVLAVGEAPNLWLLDRQLLRDGLTRPVVPGGDVCVVPGPNAVGVHLSSPNGRMIILFDPNELDMFVQAVYLTVPEGRETARINWDDLPEVLA